MEHLFEFQFKGNREYVHGTDITNHFLTFFSEQKPTNIDIKFHGIVKNNLLMTNVKSEGVKADIRCFLDGEKQSFFLYEDSSSVTSRYEYDESLILAKSEIDLAAETIALTSSTGFTACENFVALNKELLTKLYPEELGKWYFTRLELPAAISDNSLLTVQLVKNFNFRLTKSTILIDGIPAGNVYFTLVRN